MDLRWTLHVPHRTAQVAAEVKKSRYLRSSGNAVGVRRAGSAVVFTHRQPAGLGRALVPVRRARITQTYEGTHQIRRVVMARQLLK